MHLQPINPDSKEPQEDISDYPVSVRSDSPSPQLTITPQNQEQYYQPPQPQQQPPQQYAYPPQQPPQNQQQYGYPPQQQPPQQQLYPPQNQLHGYQPPQPQPQQPYYPPQQPYVQQQPYQPQPVVVIQNSTVTFNEAKAAEEAFYMALIVSLIIFVFFTPLCACVPFLFVLKYTRSSDATARHYGSWGRMCLLIFGGISAAMILLVVGVVAIWAIIYGILISRAVKATKN
jgi:hypothetical protein